MAIYHVCPFGRNLTLADVTLSDGTFIYYDRPALQIGSGNLNIFAW